MKYLLSISVLMLTFVSYSQNKSNEPLNNSKPNIVIFFTDDQGHADVGVYGQEKIIK